MRFSNPFAVGRNDSVQCHSYNRGKVLTHCSLLRISGLRHWLAILMTDFISHPSLVSIQSHAANRLIKIFCEMRQKMHVHFFQMPTYNQQND